MVFDIKRYAIHDGPGIRTTVFLKGCPLKCWWCHCVDTCTQHAITVSDPGIATDTSRCDLCEQCAASCSAEAREIVGKTMTVKDVMTEVVKDIPFYDESGGGVTFSGGEPLMQPEFLFDLLDTCRRLEIHTAVDTSGHTTRELLLEAAAKTDLVLYDLKHMDPEIHAKYTGVTNQAILDNLRSIAATNTKIHVRIPLMPGINDNRRNIHDTGSFLQPLRNIECVDILPAHNEMTNKYRRFGVSYRMGRIAVPDAAHVHKVAEILAGYGLRVTIGGNDQQRANSQIEAS
jgi:pyruvate formate lyase activating enzyme